MLFSLDLMLMDTYVIICNNALTSQPKPYIHASVDIMITSGALGIITVSTVASECKRFGFESYFGHSISHFHTYKYQAMVLTTWFPSEAALYKVVMSAPCHKSVSVLICPYMLLGRKTTNKQFNDSTNRAEYVVR